MMLEEILRGTTTVVRLF